MKSVIYNPSPEEIERRSLAGERFRVVCNTHRIEKTEKLHDWRDSYDVKRYSAKRKKLRDELFIVGKVLVLAEKIEKKSVPGKFHKQSVQNISYFNKERTFIIRKIQLIDGIKYYWLKDAQNNRKLEKRFQRTELYAIKGNFIIM